MPVSSSRMAGAPIAFLGKDFYFQMAVACAGVAFIGFAPTYWLPLLSGELNAKPVTHLHALVFFAWSLLFVAQTWLAKTKSLSLHRGLGMAAISLATAMVILGVWVAIDRMHAAGAIGRLEAGMAFAIVPLLGITFFAVAFALAIVHIRRSEWHKRLMLLAAISILDAAIARWFLTFLAPPGAAGPPPVAVTVAPALVASLLLVVAMIHDLRRRGKVHEIYWIGFIAYVAVKLIQVPLSETGLWRGLAGALMALGG